MHSAFMAWTIAYFTVGFVVSFADIGINGYYHPTRFAEFNAFMGRVAVWPLLLAESIYVWWRYR